MLASKNLDNGIVRKARLIYQGLSEFSCIVIFWHYINWFVQITIIIVVDGIILCIISFYL